MKSETASDLGDRLDALKALMGQDQAEIVAKQVATSVSAYYDHIKGAIHNQALVENLTIQYQQGIMDLIKLNAAATLTKEK